MVDDRLNAESVLPGDESEESYREEDDEDFNPDQIHAENEEEDDYDNLGSNTVDYSNIDTGTGGLVKTRRAREQEEAEEQRRRRRYEHLGDVNVDSQNATDTWAELREEGVKRLKTNAKSVLRDPVVQAELNSQGEQNDTILIERVYKFANDTVREKKRVPRNSAEAKEYLSSLRFTAANPATISVNKEPNETTKLDTKHCSVSLRKPMKRPPILEKIIAGSLKPKLTTLEKSKIDWASYVDNEGINHELALHNKDGYLAKQEFLNQVQYNKDKEYSKFRQKELELKYQDR